MAQLGKLTKTELATCIFWYNVAREVCLYLVWCETVDWALIQRTDLTYKICALLDELTLGFLVKLVIKFALKFF